MAVGARWHVRRAGASLLSRAQSDDTLLVTAVEPRRRFAFELVGARLRVELTLETAGVGRTNAVLTVQGPLVVAFSRNLPKSALARLHDLCQTAATI
jgi:hypothetical protein